MNIQYKLLSTDHELKVNWWQVDYETSNKRGSFKTALDITVTENDAAKHFKRRAALEARLP